MVISWRHKSKLPGHSGNLGQKNKALDQPIFCYPRVRCHLTPASQVGGFPLEKPCPGGMALGQPCPGKKSPVGAGVRVTMDAGL